MTPGGTEPIHDASGASWWLDGGLIRPIRKFSGAVVIAAGPWHVSVVALAVASVTMQPVLGVEAVEDLRLTVVYAFCLAPLVAGPVGAVAARLVGAEIDRGEFRQTSAIFLVAALASALIAELMALLLVLVLGIGPFDVAAAFVFLSGAAALLWTSFAVLTALKAYGLLIWSFAGGRGIGLGLIMLATRGEIDTEILIWSFTAGIAICVCFAVIRVRRVAGGNDGDFVEAARTLLAEVWRLRLLALGVELAIIAVWIDKWVFWASPVGMRSVAGFLHYSPYDSVMFVAHISAIPSYAALLMFNDGDLRRVIEVFRERLRDGSTYARIRGSIDAMSQAVWSGIFSIVFLQAALTAGMVLMAPALVKALDFNFVQFLTLRVGLIGVFLHAFFLMSCAVLLVCNRARVFLALQASFMIGNFLASLGFYHQVGISAYAFFVSSLVMAVVGFLCAYQALIRFDYLTFLGENDAFYTR
jgi:uncharacterized membrane protein